MGISIIFLLIAAMDPVLPMAQQQVESQGLDIVIVMDLSESMQELMDRESLSDDSIPDQTEMMTMTPAGKTRLQTTKETLRSFILQRREDRIGMVVFADNAYIVSPLTLDHDFLLHYLDLVDANILRNERKTAIGEGISLANSLLLRQRGGERRGQVIMVYTDGEHNHGRDPLETLPQSYMNEIKVHLVGVDLEQRIRDKENVQQLMEAVRKFGGKFFDANTSDDLIAASVEIDTLEKGRIVTREYTRQVAVYSWFASPAAVMMLLAFALRTIPYFCNYT
jgi:Ca-activated chloride channel family protein